MKGKIVKEEKGFNPEMPKDFDILDIIYKGRQIKVDVRELMEIANIENRTEIISVMNKCAGHYHYFGQLKIRIEDYFDEKQEDFDLWLAAKMSKYKEETSEKARERCVMVDYKDDYCAKKKELRDLESFKKQAEVAWKALDKNISLIQSIGAMVRGGENGSKYEPKPSSGDFD